MRQKTNRCIELERSTAYNHVTAGRGSMATSTSRRKIVSMVLGAVVLVLLAGFAALNAFNLKFLNPATAAETLVFIVLSFIAFLIFVAVLVLLVRNVLKLYAEQSKSLMGTRLQTRMLWGAALISLIPLGFMFFYSYGLMNRAVDRWFSQNPNEIRDDSNRLAQELAQYTSTNARVEAESIAASLPAVTTGSSDRSAHNSTRRPAPTRTPTMPDKEAIDRVLHQHEITLQGGFIVVYREGRAVAAFHLPLHKGAPAQVKPWPSNRTSSDEDDTDADLPRDHTPGDDSVVDVTTDAAILAAARRSDLPIFSQAQTDYTLGSAALDPNGVVVVGLPMPYGMLTTVSRFQSAVDDYRMAYNQRRQVRTLYMQLLMMMTVLALFACTWLAGHLARQVTRPVEALADAMQAIAAGDYAHRVAESATEELGELVRSFNHMAADLDNSRRAVQVSTQQLSAANATLEARRSELETMLESIPNGVATLDIARHIVLANRALVEMLDSTGQTSLLGTALDSIFPAEAIELLNPLFQRSHRMGTASGEMELTLADGTGSRTMNLMATVALLETGNGSDRIHHGYVLVLEDATELLRAQKQSAWREVARRVAHEIKNPLTPISLSAEQIHRHIDRLDATLATAQIESPSVAVIRRSSAVISSAVESMRSLVDQFSALAQFPTAQPRPVEINPIVESSLALFAGRLQKIRLIQRLSPDLPLVLADPEATKRALGNLIDNAAEAMQQSLLRELRITTALLPSGMVELAISDTGSGLTNQMRERLFLPYFSTKQRGTGLGLSIAAKIIQEQQGTIRAEKNHPVGARFIIELRSATMDSEPTQETATATETAASNT
jgi:nitrogen fixation/metabolism regulation signal transduction histidine kinase